MKRLFTLLLISFAALSCEMIDEKIDDLLDKRDWVVFAEGTELTANVPSKQTVLNYKFESTLDWEVKTDAEWLEIDPMRGKAGKDIKIQIKVAKNKDKEGRTGYADLTLSNDESYRITINQAGEGDENEDIVVDIPNNQIWYTSVNGEVVEPYTGEYNEYADALKTFGGNIVSNTYADGKGVIEFDGDVTVIGQFAFYYCNSLTSVTIPDSVTTIGNYTFQSCSSLTSVTIPDSVTTIGDGAFSNCNSLTSVTIPDSVTTIGYVAFLWCESLTSVTIPDSVTTIGRSAFAYCSSLTSVTIPDSVTTIGDDAFWSCKTLTSITIPDSVTTIEESAFAGCSSLQEFNGKFASEDGRCLIIVGTLNAFAPAGLTEYTIPDSVTTIGYSAFYNCSSLTSVIIPDSVTTIRDYAFYNCSSLTSVTIGDSVTKVENFAFYDCSSLASVYCKATTPPAGGYKMFDDNASGRKIYVPTGSVEAYKSASGWSDYADAIVGYDFDRNEEVVQPEQPEEIPKNQIWYTSIYGEIVEPYSGEDNNYADAFTTFGVNIVSNTYVDGKGVIEFDGDVTTIGDYAFWHCDSLTSVTIPNSVTIIGEGAFASCYELTSAIIGDSVTVIGMGAFSECESLTSVTIPDSVTTIGDYAFGWCSNLQEFNGKFVSEDGRCLIIDGVLNSFAPAGLTEYTIPDSVTTIGNSAFSGCSSLTSVTIGDSVTTIGDGAFCSCDSLTSVTIPDSVTTIGDWAFCGCSSLTSVTIPDSVTPIGDWAFAGCSSLTSVTIPDSVITIGYCAFAYCDSLASVTIPDSVTSIVDEAFRYCYSLTSVYCKATTPPVVVFILFDYWCGFYDNASGRKIYVPMESVEAYKSAEGWSEYADDIVGYNF